MIKKGILSGNFLAPWTFVELSLKDSFMELFYCSFLYETSIMWFMENEQKNGFHSFSPKDDDVKA